MSFDTGEKEFLGAIEHDGEQQAKFYGFRIAQRRPGIPAQFHGFGSVLSEKPGSVLGENQHWYNRAGVEHVMGFCTEEEYREFLRACPLFEDMLVRSGIRLIKYWFLVSDEVQERRFIERMHNPIKRWKLSPMDLESRERWVEYSKAKDRMLKYTDSKHAPWYIVDAHDKKSARLNCIAHLLGQIAYQDLRPVQMELPPRQPDSDYQRPKKSSQNWVPAIYAAPS